MIQRRMRLSPFLRVHVLCLAAQVCVRALDVAAL